MALSAKAIAAFFKDATDMISAHPKGGAHWKLSAEQSDTLGKRGFAVVDSLGFAVIDAGTSRKAVIGLFIVVLLWFFVPRIRISVAINQASSPRVPQPPPIPVPSTAPPIDYSSGAGAPLAGVDNTLPVIVTPHGSTPPVAAPAPNPGSFIAPTGPQIRF